VGILDSYEYIQYFFFTNYLSREYLSDLQILLRFQLKTEYLYTESISPLELLHLYDTASKIEEEKKKKLEESKNS
jgi:hypothetical protein